MKFSDAKNTPKKQKSLEMICQLKKPDESKS